MNLVTVTAITTKKVKMNAIRNSKIPTVILYSFTLSHE